ncbi:transglutaminase domain-containing protein [Hymenobacter oligotrophus]|uniref:Transglutaminase domain-containing protein n=1 Tax=Hymenobacter oligotrophus TaxID=2319843 RepID=A0A3B7R6C9_9BACT|nr:transglutaminase-like domain-containing protein [Hymenobacter oligotrophus]AYA36911.1 transglutaminase domain-containing protein [Hymenobacter oligotrophus]
MPRIATLLFLFACLGATPTIRAQPAAPKLELALPYSTEPAAAGATFQFSSPNSAYLQTLRERYGLEAVVANQPTALGKAQALCAWVHNRLTHDGRSACSKADPLGILEEVTRGKAVQCVEFGRVLAGALTAVGLPARPLYLKAKNADTRAAAGGHVLTEVWLPDYQKWVVVDGQWDVIPTLNGVPLNAAELSGALASGAAGLDGLTSSNAKIRFYYRWLRPYLYYLDAPLDNRYEQPTAAAAHLMLVPLGAENLTTFQRTTRLRGMRYTSSLADFYPPLTAAAPPQPAATTWPHLPH